MGGGGLREKRTVGCPNVDLQRAFDEIHVSNPQRGSKVCAFTLQLSHY